MPTYTQKEPVKSSTRNIRDQRKFAAPKLNPIGNAIELYTPLELGFTLDRSESMQTIWQAAVRGFNALLAEQPRTPGVEARFSSSLFNGLVQPIHNRAPLAEVEPIDPSKYRPSGSTALLDGIGKIMQVIAAEWDHVLDAAHPVKPRVLIAILTDGAENSSIHFDEERIFREIHFRRLACNWQFLFFCANKRGVAYGLRLGIPRVNIAEFTADSAGIVALMGRVSKAMSAYALGDRNYSRFLLK